MVAWPEGAAAMSDLALQQIPRNHVDLRRWPGLAPPKRAYVQAILARAFFRRVASSNWNSSRNE